MLGLAISLSIWSDACMALYSLLPERRARQLLGDIAVAVWILFWIWQGWSTHQAISEATRATETASQAAINLDNHLGLAAAALGAIPLLGDTVAAPFVHAAEAAGRLQLASALGTETIESLALKLGVGVAVTPTVLLLVAWLPRRLAQVRRSSPAWAGEPELLALRALVTQRPEVLHALADDPVEGWRRGDLATISALADHQRAYDGIVPSATASGAGATGPGGKWSGEPPAAAPEPRSDG